MGMLIKGLGGPLDGQVVVESPDGHAQPEVLVPEGRRIGRYGLMLSIPPGEGPMGLVYQWKGWVA